MNQHTAPMFHVRGYKGASSAFLHETPTLTQVTISGEYDFNILVLIGRQQYIGPAKIAFLLVANGDVSSKHVRHIGNIGQPHRIIKNSVA